MPNQSERRVALLPATVFCQYWRQLQQEWAECKLRAVEVKRVRRDFFSYFLFAILLGQIGVLTTVVWSAFGEDSLIQVVYLQAKSGNFLTFQIALLLAGASKFFDEHGESTNRDYVLLRLTHLLIAFFLAFMSMLAYIFLGTVDTGWVPGPVFATVNIALWVLSMWIASRLHLTFAATEESAEEYTRSKNNDVISQAAALDLRKQTKLGGDSFEI